MGIIIGKLRKKKTTEEALDSIDKEIKTIEEYRKNTEQAHKIIVGRFIVISVGVYLFTAFLFYFYYFPANFYDQLFYIIPLIFAPVIILTVKRGLSWYYKWKISRKQNKLSTLREDKKKLLENVMETETYKVAKSILEKFAEPVIRKNNVVFGTSDLTTPKQYITPMLTSSAVTAGGLRQRALPPPQLFNNQLFPAITPAKPVTNIPGSLVKTGLGPTPVMPQIMPANASTPLPMPRAILPRERSVFDKMVDYLVGDGPSNRYALICKGCSSHNGMALQEEFEYISFRCCYCFLFNPARKKRPAAPKLQYELKPQVQTDTSGSEMNSPTDTDSDSETINDLASTATVKDMLDKTQTVDTDVNGIDGIKPLDELETTEPIAEGKIELTEKKYEEAVKKTEDQVSNDDGNPKD